MLGRRPRRTCCTRCTRCTCCTHRTRLGPSRQQDRCSQDEEFVDERDRIWNQHVQKEQRASDAQDGARAEPREKGREHPLNEKRHTSSVPRLA